ncbi:PWP2 [Symbiodinium sp. KB8]|nr:PWP2 [Symbiodinium sp. KB8]
MCLSPDGRLLVTVDKDGRALVIAMARRSVLHRINFKVRPRAIKFSPNGAFLAVATGRHVQIWRAPPAKKQVAPLALVRKLTGHFDDVVDLAWSQDSVHIVTASMDATARVHTARPVAGFVPVTLSGHRAPLVLTAFADASTIHTVSADGAAYTWKWERRAVMPSAIVSGLSGAGKGTITPKALAELVGSGMAKFSGDDDEMDFDAPEEDSESELGSDQDSEQSDDEDDDESKSSGGDGTSSDDGEASDEDDDQVDDSDVDVEGPSDDGEAGSRKRARDDADDSDAEVERTISRPIGTRQNSAVGARRTVEKHMVPDPSRLDAAASANRLSIGVGEWVLRGRHLFMQDGARVVSASYNRNAKLLVAGFDTGVFTLYSLDPSEDARVAAGLVKQEAPRPKGHTQGAQAAASDGPRVPATDMGLSTAGDIAALTAASGLAASTCDAIHSLSIGTSPVTTSAISPSGDWLAFGTAETGQLLVWEWQSESYILKQRGHAHVINAVAWSPDGQTCATGGDDGKIKLWSAKSGFCYVTFSDHRAPVTGLTFIGGRGGRAQAVLSSCLDGTVKAYDLARYRNFRTMTGPSPRQFTCVTADSDGDLVAAGSVEPFEICVWSLRTGKLLDLLAGHEGPVTSVSFAPDSSMLASSSWDTTVRIWDPAATGGGAATETLKHGADVLDVAWRPDGERLVAATRDGQLHFWDPQDGRQTGVISARQDAAGGRTQGSVITAKSADSARHFSCVSYSNDGELVIAGGRTNFVCVYAAAERLLLRKFALTHSRDMDGVTKLLNSKRLTDTGVSMDTMDGGHASLHAGEDEDDRLGRRGRGMGIAADAALPGASRAGAAGSRSVIRETRCRALAFAPTGRALAVASVEGLLLFGQDETLMFDPVDLTAEVTPEAVRRAIDGGEAPKALAMALHLSETELIVEAAAAVGPGDAMLAARAVPARLVPKLLSHLAEQLRTSRHLELWAAMLSAFLSCHSSYLRAHPAAAAGPVRAVMRAALAHREGLARMARDNADLVSFIASRPAAATTAALVGGGAAAVASAGLETTVHGAHDAVRSAALSALPASLRAEVFGSAKFAHASPVLLPSTTHGPAADDDSVGLGSGEWEALPSAWEDED